MIIIIGKEDKKRLLDCACYVSECGDNYRDSATAANHYIDIAKDCWKLSDWLRKIANINIFKKH